MKLLNGSMIWMGTILIVSVFLALSNSVLTIYVANAQSSTSVTAGTNYTKLVSENKEFQVCSASIPCYRGVNVLYQGPVMLVLESSHFDVIWKVVEFAKKEGYKIDGISTYTHPSGYSEQPISEVLVAMSKG